MRIRIRRLCVPFRWCILRGRGRTPPLRQPGQIVRIRIGAHQFATLCCTILSSRLRRATSLYTREALVRCKRRTSQNVQPFPHQSALPTASPQGEAFGFCKPAGAHRTLASPFGGGVRAKRRTERVSQQRSHRPSQSASLTALPKGEPRNFCKPSLPQKGGGRPTSSLFPITSRACGRAGRSSYGLQTRL